MLFKHETARQNMRGAANFAPQENLHRQYLGAG